MGVFDGEEFGRNIVAAVNASIERSVAPLIARLDALEALGVRHGKDADPVDMDAVRAMIVEECKDVRAGLEATIGPEMQESLSVMVKEAVGAIDIPAPRDGVDGKSVTLDDIRPLIDEAVKAIPPARDGKDADPVDVVAIVDQVRSAIVIPELPDVKGMVDEAVKAIPAPKDGKDGKDGRDGTDGAAGQDGRNGRDGADVTNALISDGHLHLVLSNGETKNVGRVVGSDGANVDMDAVRAMVDAIPKPRDGMGFDDLTMEYDGERTFKFVMIRGTDRREHTFTMPVILDRGVYSDGKAYAQGDFVTWAGSTWVAQTADATEKPGTGKQWRLAVKRGSNGKDGVMTIPRANVPVKLGAN
jgi:hypothetical protein